MDASDYQSQFEQLINRNRGRLVGIARCYARGDVEDLLQEIFLQLWRSLPRFKQQASIDTWCFRIALNTGIPWQRKVGRRREKLRAEPADLYQVAGTSDGKNSPELLDQFLQTLTDIDRAIVVMYMEDMSGRDMAEAVGISEGALRTRIHRIKQRLADWKVGDE